MIIFPLLPCKLDTLNLLICIKNIGFFGNLTRLSSAFPTSKIFNGNLLPNMKI